MLIVPNIRYQLINASASFETLCDEQSNVQQQMLCVKGCMREQNKIIRRVHKLYIMFRFT